MRRIILAGNGPLTNRGCEAIVLGSVRILEKEFGPASFLLASFSEDSADGLPRNIHPLALPYERPRLSPAWFSYQIERFLGRPEKVSGFLKRLEEKTDGATAAFSIGGDGYSIDYGHQIVDRLILMDRYFLLHDVPVIIWGASIGPFDKEPEFEHKMADHFAAMSLVVVRDPLSLDYLRLLGVTKNVLLAPDPAFALVPMTCAIPEAVEQILEKPCIGINFSPLLARFASGGSLHRWTVQAAQIIDMLQEKTGYPVLLVPHASFRHRNPAMDDSVFLQEVFNALSLTSQAQTALVPNGLGSESLKWIISRTAVFVGARTHSTIAALSSCVPCLSIAYSRKAWGINELVYGNRDWVFSSKDMDPDRLSDQVLKLIQNREQVQSYLKQVIPGMLDRAFQSAKQVRIAISGEKRAL